MEDFWKPRILIPSSPPQDAQDQWQERAWPALEIVDVFDAGRERARMARGMRGAKTVPGVELCLALGDDVSTCVEIKFSAFVTDDTSTSTPSTRRLLDGVAMPVPHRSTVQRNTLVDFHTLDQMSTARSNCHKCPRRVLTKSESTGRRVRYGHGREARQGDRR